MFGCRSKSVISGVICTDHHAAWTAAATTRRQGQRTRPRHRFWIHRQRDGSRTSRRECGSDEVACAETGRARWWSARWSDRGFRDVATTGLRRCQSSAVRSVWIRRNERSPLATVADKGRGPGPVQLSATGVSTGWWHATKWPSPIGLSCGSSCEQMSVAYAHRGWNRQPDGGATGDGGSPMILPTE